jgi:hypothetical protein
MPVIDKAIINFITGCGRMRCRMVLQAVPVAMETSQGLLRVSGTDAFRMACFKVRRAIFGSVMARVAR